MNEIWRPVPRWEGVYEISSLGRVKSLPRYRVPVARILDMHLDQGGYYAVQLQAGGRKEKARAHTLMARAFLPGVGALVRHLNDRRDDNRLENLAWGMDGDNLADRIRNQGHHNTLKTHCPQGHEYTNDNTGTGRRRNGTTFRVCRRCVNNRYAARAGGQ